VTTSPVPGGPESESTNPVDQGGMVLPGESTGAPARLAPPLPHDDPQ
jgi:hypothetical protein